MRAVSLPSITPQFHLVKVLVFFAPVSIEKSEFMKYLYTGWLAEFGSCETRRRALEQMGKEVVAQSFVPYIQSLGSKIGKFQDKFAIGPGVWSYNRRLLALATAFRPNVVWVDKGTLVSPSTLRAIKRQTKAILVHYNTDDIEFKPLSWRLHLAGVREYDFYFTTNAYNIERLKALGAQTAILTRLGYDRDVVKSQVLSAEELKKLGAEVGFIGHWEPATEEYVLRLVEMGLPLRVRGTLWERARSRRRLARNLEPGGLPFSDYIKGICATKINLGFNSTQNRNQSSGRSFEIPAAGGFLLAQRTTEHRALYEEGVEAQFFESPEELVTKARYYLEHEQEREQIAAAGHKRCTTSRYSWQEQMCELVCMVESSSGRRV